MTGVNQSDADLLEQLRDLHLPDSVHWWPLAPGWWVVAAVLVAITIVVLLALYRRFARRASSDSLTDDLDELYQQCEANGATALYYDRILSVAKRAAIQSTNSVHISKLSGTAWVEWMERASGSDFHATTRAALAKRGYQRDPPLPDRRSHDEICRWISQIRKTQSPARSEWQRRFKALGTQRA